MPQSFTNHKLLKALIQWLVPLGPKPKADSASVTFASDQGPLPVTFVAGSGGGTGLDITHPYLENQVGNWGYIPGISGTVTLTGGKKVIGIAAHSTIGGTMSINGGANIVIPEKTGVQFIPMGNLIDATVIFSNTDSFIIEYLS